MRIRTRRRSTDEKFHLSCHTNTLALPLNMTVTWSPSRCTCCRYSSRVLQAASCKEDQARRSEKLQSGCHGQFRVGDQSRNFADGKKLTSPPRSVPAYRCVWGGNALRRPLSALRHSSCSGATTPVLWCRRMQQILVGLVCWTHSDRPRCSDPCHVS